MILDVFFNLCDSMTLKNSIVFMVYENPEIKVNILKTKILRNLERLGYDKKKKSVCYLLSLLSFLKVQKKREFVSLSFRRLSGKCNRNTDDFSLRSKLLHCKRVKQVSLFLY